MNLTGVINLVLDVFNTKLPSHYFYHNSTHSLDVLNATKIISHLANLRDEDFELVCTAAILHDVGYVFQYYQNEPLSVKFAQEKLPQFKYNASQIGIVCDCIMATVIPQQATNQLQMILCDADLDYLGRSDYFTIAHNLRREWASENIVLSDLEWNCKQIDFLTNHKYYTQVAQNLRNEIKTQNILTLLSNKSKL